MAKAPGFSSEDARARYDAAYRDTFAAAGISVEHRDVRTSFGSTHVVEAGDATLPALVLLHSMSFSSGIWARNVAAFSEHHHVFAVDTIGDVNLSRCERLPRGRADLMDWLVELLQALGIERAALAGNSYGGWLAVNLALHRPELVTHLALVAPATTFVRFRPGFYLQLGRALAARTPAQAEKFARWFISDGALQDETARLWLEQYRVGRPAYRRLYRFPPPRGLFTDAQLRSITQPLLLIEGRDEPIHDPVAAVERANRHVPHATTALLDGVRHVAQLEAPERVNELISAHLVAQAGG